MRKIALLMSIIFMLTLFSGCNAAHGDDSSMQKGESDTFVSEDHFATDSGADDHISEDESDDVSSSTDVEISESDSSNADESDVNVSPPAEHSHSGNEWLFDDDEHWKECECGEKFDGSTHTFSSTVTNPTEEAQGYSTHICNECDYSYKDSFTEPTGTFSEGLKYEVNDDGTTCTIVGIGMCTDSELKIPPVIDGYSVTAIGNGAFVRNGGLKSVIIPSSVITIGDNSFSTCEGIERIVVGDRVVSIGEKAFYFCTSLVDIKLGKSVKTIGGSAFFGCYNFETIELPDTVEVIGGAAFSTCYSLVSITIPEKVTEIEGSVFSLCSALSEVIFLGKVTRIGDWAFYNCDGLKEIELPSSLTHIEEWAFEACDGFAEITIPEKVISISKYAFGNCPNITSVVFADSSGWYVTETEGGTLGTEVDVSDTSTAANFLKSEYAGNYWYKK